ncbi:hypothetical protein O181_131002 [Austropuccinia psidii MF-1]|uniref:Integrase zinc-binding domain-containing protein n=1 Tax=Austropuccinia psidii MF-1 TaxID=1389203 RepID=A0A9Q3L4V5_9BASI|nr:hypothetical protein [Austropuccinia psidii MF-1]
MWQSDVAEYCKTCDRCQKANESTGKRLGNMMKIQEPSRPWEIVHMDWVTGLPPGGDRSHQGKSCINCRPLTSRRTAISIKSCLSRVSVTL